MKDPMQLPYSYLKLEKIDNGKDCVHPICYPLVVYFEKDSDRAAFAKVVRAGIKSAGQWTIGHLK